MSFNFHISGTACRNRVNIRRGANTSLWTPNQYVSDRLLPVIEIKAEPHCRLLSSMGQVIVNSVVCYSLNTLLVFVFLPIKCQCAWLRGKLFLVEHYLEAEHRTSWSNYYHPCFQFIRHWLKSRPETEIFVVLLISSIKMPEKYLKLSQNQLLSQSFQLVVP